MPVWLILWRKQVLLIYQLQEQKYGWKAIRRKMDNLVVKLLEKKCLVFGKEIRGRVYGMGFGVAPSKVGASLQQNETIKQLQSMMHNLQQEVQLMRSIVFQSTRQQNEREHVGSGGNIGIENDIGSGCDINRPKKSCNADNVNQHQVASRSNLKNVSNGDVPDNIKCKLLH
ncbi:uncharacterized protein [Primulina eburnea]|uniref:uncharacterized protein isoform X4 n=1 Tax=Primulina eburnea TaxID=1245227 RepID=UPI003C6CB565